MIVNDEYITERGYAIVLKVLEQIINLLIKFSGNELFVMTALDFAIKCPDHFSAECIRSHQLCLSYVMCYNAG